MLYLNFSKAPSGLFWQMPGVLTRCVEIKLLGTKSNNLVHKHIPMHKLTKLTPLIRKEIYRKYKEKMKITRGKWKEEYYKELAEYYRIHYNVIRKIIKRGKNGDFRVHKSTTKANLWHNFKKYLKAEKKIEKRINRLKWHKIFSKKALYISFIKSKSSDL